MKAKTFCFGLVALLALLLTFCFAPVDAGAQTDTAVAGLVVAPPSVDSGAVDVVATGVLKKDVTVDQLLNWWTLGSMALVNILPFLLGLLKISFFNSDKKRDLLAKTLVAGGLAVFTVVSMGGGAWPAILGFVGGIVNYNNVLKPLGVSTPTPATGAPAD